MKSSRGSKSGSLKILSMTGFGRATVKTRTVEIEVEIKSVNSRHLDLSLKLPRVYNQFELDLRELIGRSLGRGRVECLVQRLVNKSVSDRVNFDPNLCRSFLTIYRNAAREMGIKDFDSQRALHSILERKEVLDTVPQVKLIGSERVTLLKAVSGALADLQSARALEGRALGRDLISRLEILCTKRNEIQSLVKNSTQELNNKLHARIGKLVSEDQVDTVRLATEVALMADRLDVSEELVRISSHILHFRQIIGNSSNGRKLEFMLQEFGREFNTISSKIQNAKIQLAVVDAKAEIEKMREQVQNIE